MTYETFVVDRDGAVATVWFNRPEILNPINFRALLSNRAGDITFADAYLGAGCADGEDTAEAITAFREKRAGRYRNR